MNIVEAYIAATRFGLGARPGELTKYSNNNAKNWLHSQIDQYNPNSPYFSELYTGKSLYSFFNRRDNKGEENRKRFRKQQQEIKGNEINARILNGVTTQTPFIERLVYFWSNHFTVSTSNRRITGLAGLFEREAIRPHVLGNFEDMLLAVVQHPAMLIYLDNHHSIGPNSKAGLATGRGLNENLAREILELHTLGVNGGYNQGDVIALAKIITGWTFTPEQGYTFMYRRHEPGEHVLLGRSYSQQGEEQGIAALKDLAFNSSTANFIATKLVSHFVSDNPSKWAVRQIANIFKKTRGDLKQVAMALVDLNDAWQLEPGKIKSANDFIISAARAVGSDANVDTRFLAQSLRAFGQYPFTANSPAGFSDKAKEWIGPASVLRRVEWSQIAARKLMTQAVDQELANQILHPVLSPESYDMIKQTYNRQEILAMIFALPEFQRR